MQIVLTGSLKSDIAVSAFVDVAMNILRNKNFKKDFANWKRRKRYAEAKKQNGIESPKEDIN